jgi:acyl-CoA dehydrogenase
VYYEELGQAMMPIPAQHWTLETLGPALIRFAPSLAAAYLPGYLSGTEWRGQSFSEPESGSDLATLRYPRGRRWRRRIRHQRPQDLDQPGAHGHPAAGVGPHRNAGEPTPRTDHDHGDADAPGVTIRPIALASGRRELAEVFFDDVRVDRERIVGDVDGGWAVPMHLMQYERGMYGYAVLNKVLSELSRLREDMVNAGAMDAQRQRFARVYVDVAAAQARTATTVRRLAAGQAAGADISIDKLLFGRAEKEVNDLILEITRDQMVAGTGRGGAELDTARAEWWYSRAPTVMGGTAEVQRGIIADHLLGLPKEKR